jgi:hypothetical protein
MVTCYVFFSEQTMAPSKKTTNKFVKRLHDPKGKHRC